MATYNEGPFGGFKGKLGTVVGTTWRGMNIMRSLPEKSGKAPSAAQELQRSKLKLTMSFLTPIRALTKITFRKNLMDKGGFDRAKSYFMKEALQSNEGEWQINYAKVLISSGELRGLTNPEIAVAPNEILNLQWMVDSGQAMANATDKLVLVLYLPSLNQFEIFENVATRQEGSAVINYASYYMGLEAQCWASFGNANGSKYAVSTYMGVINL